MLAVYRQFAKFTASLLSSLFKDIMHSEVQFDYLKLANIADK